MLPVQFMTMLDEVAAVVLPKLGATDLEATQQKLDDVAHKFEAFTNPAEGEQLPDSGERLDLKSILNSRLKG